MSHGNYLPLFFHSLIRSIGVLIMMIAINLINSTHVDGWIDSPGHRKNLLGRFTHCGIGVFCNDAGAYYSTQLFSA
jgi:hypothetical protein